MARDHLEEEALITLSRLQREAFDARPNGLGGPVVLQPGTGKTRVAKEKRNGR